MPKSLNTQSASKTEIHLKNPLPELGQDAES